MHRLAFLSLFLIAACGSNKGGDEGPPPAVGEARFQLVLFGAPWCTECKSDLPEISKLFQSAPKTVQSAIQVTLYVTTGAQPNEPPTDPIALGYAKFVKLGFAKAMPDPWMWQKFRSYIPGSLALPAAALLNEEGDVVRAFTATAGFIPQEVVGFAIKTVQENPPQKKASGQ